MPCISGNNENCERDLRKEVDVLTDMLCRICSKENYGVVEMRLPDDIQVWWLNHKMWDTKRKGNNK